MRQCTIDEREWNGRNKTKTEEIPHRTKRGNRKWAKRKKKKENLRRRADRSESLSISLQVKNLLSFSSLSLSRPRIPCSIPHLGSKSASVAPSHLECPCVGRGRCQVLLPSRVLTMARPAASAHLFLVNTEHFLTLLALLRHFISLRCPFFRLFSQLLVCMSSYLLCLSLATRDRLRSFPDTSLYRQELPERRGCFCDFRYLSLNCDFLFLKNRLGLWSLFIYCSVILLSVI